MNPIDHLMSEHVNILQMLNVLDKVCDKMENENDFNLNDLDDIIDFIIKYADQCHHMKEEDLLFPELAKVGLPLDGGPVGVMLIEHNQGRSHVQLMKKAVSSLRSGDISATNEFLENGFNFSGLLKQHIHKEDNILYPMAINMLSENTMDELTEKFRIVDDKKIGQDKIEAYLEKLASLKIKYGVI